MRQSPPNTLDITTIIGTFALLTLLVSALLWVLCLFFPTLTATNLRLIAAPYGAAAVPLGVVCGFFVRIRTSPYEQPWLRSLSTVTFLLCSLVFIASLACFGAFLFFFRMPP